MRLFISLTLYKMAYKHQLIKVLIIGRRIISNLRRCEFMCGENHMPTPPLVLGQSIIVVDESIGQHMLHLNILTFVDSYKKQRVCLTAFYSEMRSRKSV